MDKPYLEITYRQGKPFAAYLYLHRRSGDTVAKTQRRDDFLVDYSADGRPIGIEFTRVGSVNLAAVNRVMQESNQVLLSPGDLAPLSAA
jgi:uncharacterized protein YuzE